MPSVLVIDADARARRLVTEVLREAGFLVTGAADGEGVLFVVRAQRPDAVVLDLKLPRTSGLDVLRQLRGAGEDVPVVFLTAVYDEEWVVAALEAGADDYLTRPFSPRVLVARLNATLRRANGLPHRPDAGNGTGAEAVTLDPSTHEVRIGDRIIPLSPTEYQLLRTLMRGAGRVFTTDELLAMVWGPSYAGQDDIVRANIYRLRHKLEPIPSEPRYIQGRRGVGYYFSSRNSA
jgi:two-component system alkaline phosphatase synthesis response regulator PhoP